MKIAFFGTPAFAAASLEQLVATPGIEIQLVVTQPDKQVGRKMKTTAPAVKVTAEKHGIKVEQPTNNKELYEIVKDLEVDFFVVVAYGMIFKEEVLSIPKIAPVNIHASLLPKYRGASPIQQSLLNGDKESGVSIMKMGKGMDTGPVYLIQRMEIAKDDNLETLHDKLAILGALMIPNVLRDIKEGHLEAIEQSNNQVSYCKKINKSDGEINWLQNTNTILNKIRAYTPWPSAFTKIKGKNIKIIEAEDGEEKIKEGELKFTKNELKIGSKNGSISIKKLQLEGKKACSAKEFINGNQNLLTQNKA